MFNQRPKLQVCVLYFMKYFCFEYASVKNLPKVSLKNEKSFLHPALKTFLRL